jgi:hypothetical protein
VAAWNTKKTWLLTTQIGGDLSVRLQRVDVGAAAIPTRRSVMANRRRWAQIGPKRSSDRFHAIDIWLGGVGTV